MYICVGSMMRGLELFLSILSITLLPILPFEYSGKNCAFCVSHKKGGNPKKEKEGTAVECHFV